MSHVHAFKQTKPFSYSSMSKVNKTILNWLSGKGFEIIGKYSEFQALLRVNSRQTPTRAYQLIGSDPESHAAHWQIECQCHVAVSTIKIDE